MKREEWSKWRHCLCSDYVSLQWSKCSGMNILCARDKPWLILIICTLQKITRILWIFFSLFLNFKYHFFFFFFLCVIGLKCVWKRVLVYQLLEIMEKWKKLSLFPSSGKNTAWFLSSEPLSCPLPTIVCILGTLLVPWGTSFGMLQLSCGTIFLTLNQENWGVVGVPGEDKSWKHLYCSHWKFYMEWDF